MTASHFWTIFGSVMAVWAVVATFVNAKYAKPTAPKWKVIAYTVVIDIPALWAAVGKTGLVGKLNIPGLPSMTVETKGILPPDKAAALLPLALLFFGLVGCSPVQQTAAANDLQKFKDAMAKADPILKDIGAGVRDLGPCAPAVIVTVMQAIAGSPGWVATLINDYACIAQGVAQLRSDIAANRAPVPAPEHLQAVQSVVAMAAVIQKVPAPGVVTMQSQAQCPAPAQ